MSKALRYFLAFLGLYFGLFALGYVIFCFAIA